MRDIERLQLKLTLSRYFNAPTNLQSTWRFPSRFDLLMRQEEAEIREATWAAYSQAPIHAALKANFAAKVVHSAQYTSPYTVKYVGDPPGNGWGLVIAMHGGGNGPKAMNDEQWGQMQIYYRDHPEAGGYIYVALRAPNDTWNGFYDDYVYPLVSNLIRQFLVLGDVDPNKVFILGYSHGGYGAFAIGPKMPDHFAEIHASAAAPTDGETTGKTLRNTIFTYMVGERDTDYGRVDRCRKFDQIIQGLRGDRKDIYPVTLTVIPRHGHTGLPDRDILKEMYPATRNPAPRELTWLMTDKVIHDFYWLHVPEPGKGQEIDASCQDNRIVITTTTNVTAASILLDSRLIDYRRPVTLEVNGRTNVQRLLPSLTTLCRTMVERGDPDLAGSVEYKLDLEPAK
jgi:predicted esterase